MSKALHLAATRAAGRELLQRLNGLSIDVLLPSCGDATRTDMLRLLEIASEPILDAQAPDELAAGCVHDLCSLLRDLNDQGVLCAGHRACVPHQSKYLDLLAAIEAAERSIRPVAEVLA